MGQFNIFWKQQLVTYSFACHVSCKEIWEGSERLEWEIEGKTMFCHVFRSTVIHEHNRGGGDTLLFGLYGYLLLNRVWFLRSWVLNRVYNFTFKLPEQGCFWTGSLSKSLKTCNERSTLAIPVMFFLNIYFHDFSVKTFFILHAKQNKSGSESPVLNRVAIWASFVLHRVRVW